MLPSHPQYLLKNGLIDGSCMTCTGKTMAENLASCPDLSEGQEVIVKVLDIDNRNRVKLSIKEVTAEEKAAFEATPAE